MLVVALKLWFWQVSWISIFRNILRMFIGLDLPLILPLNLVLSLPDDYWQDSAEELAEDQGQMTMHKMLQKIDIQLNHPPKSYLIDIQSVLAIGMLS